MSDQNHPPTASDEHGGSHEEGGHEYDSMPNQRLFNLLFGLSALTLLCCIGLIQVFNRQAESITSARGKQGSFMLRDYRAEMRDVMESYGTTDEAGRFRMPVDKAKQLVLSDPSRLQAFPPPPDWIHPDDLATGGAGGTAQAVEDPAGAGTDPSAPDMNDSAGEDETAPTADAEGESDNGDTPEPGRAKADDAQGSQRRPVRKTGRSDKPQSAKPRSNKSGRAGDRD